MFRFVKDCNRFYGNCLHAPFIEEMFQLLLTEVMDTAARMREILEASGLAQESLASNIVASAQALANVANILNIRDTELSR